MGDIKQQVIEKHVLTENEKRRLLKTRADGSQVAKEAEKIISKHQNAIKQLAGR